MKKTLFFAAVAALFAFASCQKEVTPVQNQGEDPVFTATIASQTTKTTVDAATAKVAWVLEDKITITDSSNPKVSAEYKVSAINEGRATFTKVDGQPTLGAGPYSAVYGNDPSTSQSYSASAPSLPMNASSSTTSLEFTVTCGLLELSLTAGESITSIEVTGTPTDGSEATYTLTCSIPVSIASGAKFFIALPAGSYTSFLINGQNGAICKKEKSGESVAIAANHITPVSFKSLHFAVQLWEDGPYWATTNIGADNSTDAGLYFAWGDVTGQTWDGSAWSDGGFSTTPAAELDGDKLTPAYDAATQKWGADWSMPTDTDFTNLISGSYTSIEYVTSGTAGIKVTGKGDYATNSIFLPAAGYGSDSQLKNAGSSGYYWSSVQSNSNQAYRLEFNLEYEESSVEHPNKNCGPSVRPVRSYSAPTPTPSVLLPGEFSVSEAKKVKFTKGNLYWNGSAFKLESSQTDYPTEWSDSHVGHFYWTTLTDYQSGEASYMPYAEDYSYNERSMADKFFCGENNPLTVDGQSGLYALSKDEWSYLLSSTSDGGRGDGDSKFMYGVTVNDVAGCLVIAPDGYTGTIAESYDATAWSAAESAGLVCLPLAGCRRSDILSTSEEGHYWSATPFDEYDSNAYCLNFNDVVGSTSNDSRDYGYSVRLVYSEAASVNLADKLCSMFKQSIDQALNTAKSLGYTQITLDTKGDTYKCYKDSAQSSYITLRFDTTSAVIDVQYINGEGTIGDAASQAKSLTEQTGESRTLNGLVETFSSGDVDDDSGITTYSVFLDKIGNTTNSATGYWKDSNNEAVIMLFVASESGVGIVLYEVSKGN